MILFSGAQGPAGGGGGGGVGPGGGGREVRFEDTGGVTTTSSVVVICVVEDRGDAAFLWRGLWIFVGGGFPLAKRQWVGGRGSALGTCVGGHTRGSSRCRWRRHSQSRCWNLKGLQRGSL